jgi:hypothetical protein
LTTDRRLGTVGEKETRVYASRIMLLRAVVATALAMAIIGCGPVQYISTVSRGASADLDAAKAAGADKYAPYEYTAAAEYLHKAREEEGYADHQAAIHFGQVASDMAKKAREIALAQAASGAPPPVIPNVTKDSENENPLEAPKK